MQVEQHPFMKHYIYNVEDGTELGTVNAFDADGALKWASYLYDKPVETLAASVTPVSHKTLALHRTR